MASYSVQVPLQQGVRLRLWSPDMADWVGFGSRVQDVGLHPDCVTLGRTG